MIRDNKLLVVGGSYLQLPGIKKAKEIGLQVAVADYNPKAVGIAYADKYYNVSTLDEDGIYKAAKDYKANGIITLGTDLPMRSVAYACEKLGLNSISYETAIKSTDKGEMIQAFDSYGVTHPWFFILENMYQLNYIKNQISYPCISKPIDSSGSRGVKYISNSRELEKSIKYSFDNSRSSKVILEEYMQGSEVSVEIIVVNKKINVLAVTDKVTTGAPNFVEMRHSQPSQLSEENIRKIKELAKKAVEAVDITNGPAHVEIMLTNNGPKIIELGARMGGDFISTHLVPFSTGIDMLEAVIKQAFGEKIDVNPKFEKGSAIQYISGGTGIIKSINGLVLAKETEGVFEVKMLKKVGDQSTEISNSHDRIGYIITREKSAARAIEVCKKALSHIELNIV